MSDGLYRGPKNGQGRNKKPKVSAARKVAVEVGKTVREREAYTHEVLEKALAATKLYPEDRAFATVLALGVSATVGSLDILINKALKKPTDIDDTVRDALRVSAYELFYLGKQDHAAVSQGVELVRLVAPKADRLANAVLRKMVALKPEFPFGDPKTDLAALSLLCGFPEWLAQLLINDLGAQAAYELMMASNEQAPVYIAVNAAKATDEAVLEAFARYGEELEPQSVQSQTVPGCYLVKNARVLQEKEIAQLLKVGAIFVSDKAAQTIALLAVPGSSSAKVLEIGAGRGTKTLLLQSGAIRLLGQQVHHVTVDNHAFKSKVLTDRAKLCGISVAKALTLDATRLSPEVIAAQQCGADDGLFDSVFVDAPCSGLGTLRRHPEIRWRITQDGINELAELGYRILCAAATCVKPGGKLVFSTCTVTKCENEQTILRFMNSELGQQFGLVPVFGDASFAPAVRSGLSDAHFAVCLVRKK